MRRKTSMGDEQLNCLPDLATIASLDRGALLDLWPKAISCLVPRGISQVLMRRYISFEIQTRQIGGLSKLEVDRIARIDRASPKPQTPKMAKGTRFLREWNGITHVVELNDQGYVWNSRTYASLSAVAKAITGAHWSGPRFFGLNRQLNAKTKADPAQKGRARKTELDTYGPDDMGSATEVLRYKVAQP